MIMLNSCGSNRCSCNMTISDLSHSSFTSSIELLTERQLNVTRLSWVFSNTMARYKVSLHKNANRPCFCRREEINSRLEMGGALELTVTATWKDAYKCSYFDWSLLHFISQTLKLLLTVFTQSTSSLVEVSGCSWETKCPPCVVSPHSSHGCWPSTTPRQQVFVYDGVGSCELLHQCQQHVLSLCAADIPCTCGSLVLALGTTTESRSITQVGPWLTDSDFRFFSSCRVRPV